MFKKVARAHKQLDTIVEELGELVECIETGGIEGEDDGWFEVGVKHNELGLNAHLSNDSQKKRALIAPRTGTEIYERMRLFAVVFDIAFKAQSASMEADCVNTGAAGL